MDSLLRFSCLIWSLSKLLIMKFKVISFYSSITFFPLVFNSFHFLVYFCLLFISWVLWLAATILCTTQLILILFILIYHWQQLKFAEWSLRPPDNFCRPHFERLRALHQTGPWPFRNSNLEYSLDYQDLEKLRSKCNLPKPLLSHN